MQSPKDFRTPPNFKSTDPNLKTFQIAFALHQQGNLSGAKELYGEILRYNPEYFDAIHLSGVIAFQLRLFDESEAFYAKAVQINSNFAPLHSNRGSNFNELKRFDEALSSYKKAILIRSDYAEALNGLGDTLKELKKFDEALDSYEKAISIKPDYAEAWYNHGNTLKILQRFDEALDSYDKAISINSDYARAFNNRGNSLQHLKRFDEALASYDKAISIKPDYIEALYNRGNNLKELKRFDEALASYDKVILINPDNPEAKLAKSLILLLRGELSEGWKHYEYRLKCQNFVKNSLGTTVNLLHKTTTLKSVSDLTGKHLVLITEQGIGDVVMFASIVQDIIPFLTRLDFVVDERLVEIFEISFPSSRVFASTTYNENDTPADAVYMFIGSLGRIFRNHVSDFPTDPYLFADFNKITSWKNRLQCENKKLIGISWKGGASHTRDWARSFSLQNFLKMMPRDNFRFVNIQHNSSLHELKQAADNLNVDILSFPEPDTSDISDLSALLCALDHVVTVQNSNIHLCGALGVHCIGIIPEVPEWRYGMRGEDMIWYKNVKLIRISQEIEFQEMNLLIDSHISQKI